MDIFHVSPLAFILTAVYVLSFCALNAISILISLFYRKNFKRSSPRWGFLASMALSLLFLGLIFAGRNGSSLVMKAAQICLLGSIAGSLCSTIGLFFLMRRVRK